MSELDEVTITVELTLTDATVLLLALNDPSGSWDHRSVVPLRRKLADAMAQA